jgi:hypothetical protein
MLALSSVFPAASRTEVSVPRLLALIVPIALLAGACSGSGPSSPSPAPPVHSSAGATIAGSFGATAGSGTALTAGARPEAGPPVGVIVSVAGTTITTLVDTTGKFMLIDVPGGTRTVRFSGQGISGDVTVADVEPGQTIELALELDGSVVTLASLRRSSGPEEQVEGRIEKLPPMVPASSLVAGGRTITTDTATIIVGTGNQAMTFADLAVGQRVHVKGQPNGASLLARLIDIQNTNVTLPVNINGDVTALGAPFGPAAFTFFVGVQEVRGDATTDFIGNSAFADLIVGARVQVKGQLVNGFVQAERIKVN